MSRKHLSIATSKSAALAGLWSAQRFAAECLIVLSLALGGCVADAGDPRSGDEHLGEVEQHLCAGAQPKAAGYVWNDRAAAPIGVPYTPSLTYQHNSSGGTNTITRNGTGSYVVTLPGLGGGGSVGGIVQVTAYGSGPESCKVSNWHPTPSDIAVTVLCFDASGVPTNTLYDVSFSTYPTEVVNHGYVWVDDPFSPSSVPSTFYQFNSTCNTNTISRAGVGKYTVKFPGLAALPGDPQPGGTVKVTAYGTGSEICKVESWTAVGPDEFVDVRCFTALGAAADTLYTVTYTRGNNLFGQAAGKRAYLRVDSPSAPISDQFNSAGATNTVTHGANPGSYTVKLPGLASPGGHVEVSGAGLGSGRCKVTGWFPSGADEFVGVQCYTQTTALTDSQFTLSFYQP